MGGLAWTLIVLFGAKDSPSCSWNASVLIVYSRVADRLYLTSSDAGRSEGKSPSPLAIAGFAP